MQFSFLPSLSLIIKPLFSLQARKYPSKPTTSVLLGMMIRRRRSTHLRRVFPCVRELALLAYMRLRLLARVRVSAGIARPRKRSGVVLRAEAGQVGAGLDLAGVLAADNISGTGGTICWVPMGAQGNPYSHSSFSFSWLTKCNPR